MAARQPPLPVAETPCFRQPLRLDSFGSSAGKQQVGEYLAFDRKNPTDHLCRIIKQMRFSLRRIPGLPPSSMTRRSSFRDLK